MLFFPSCVGFLPCWSSSSLTSDQIWTRPGCKPYLFLFIVVGAIRYSPLCHSAFANAHSPALIYAALMTGGPRRTLHPPAFSSKALLQGSVCICFFWMMPAVGLPDPISLFVCLYSFLSLIFFSFSQSTFLSSILICCVYVCMNSFCCKTGFAHISSAKSSHPSGTNCSSELCQPSPIHFMNHFLSTFL